MNLVKRFDEPRAEDGRVQEIAQHRIGKFFVSQHIIESCPKQLREIFSKIIITRAECLMHGRTIEYIGFSMLFDPAEHGLFPPLYVIDVNETGNIKATRT